MLKNIIYICFLVILPVFGHGPLDDLIKSKSLEISKSPLTGRLYLERALLHEQHQAWDESYTDLQKAEELDSSLADFNFLKGRLELAQSHFRKARTYFDLSLSLDPGNFDSLLYKARSFFAEKKYREAAYFFDLAFEKQEKVSVQYFMESIRAHKLSDKTTTASLIKRIDKYMKVNEASLELRMEYFYLLYSDSHYEPALSELDKILSSVVRKEKWLLEKVRCLMALKRFAEADQALTEAGKLLQQLPDSLKRRQLFKSVLADYRSLTVLLKPEK